MKFNQMKFQKAVVISAFVLAILTFVYAYIFSTPFYPLSSGDAAEYLKKDPVGETFYYDVQPFNRTIATLAVVFVVVSLLLFMSFSQKRRRYYIFNYIAIGCYSAFGLGYSIYTCINLASWSSLYHQINFEMVRQNIQSELQNYIDLGLEGESLEALAGSIINALKDFDNNVPKDTAMFIIGFILCALIIVVSGLLIFNCFWKARNLKKEDAMYAEEDARIRAAQEAHLKALEEAMNEEAI